MGLLLLLGVLLALAKVVYVSLLLLVFLLPLNVFTGRKQRGMFFVLLFLLSGLTALYWSGVVTDKFLTYAQYNEAFRNQCTLAPESDYGLQKQALSQNPLHLVRLFYNALFHNPEFYLKSYVGHFGTYLDTPMPYWLFVSVYVFLILLAFFEPNPFLLGVRQKFLLLGAALAAQPASATLRWIQAGELEKAGDIEGAIAVYEAMYAEDSGNIVIANNLASLITTHHDDPESLARATAIVRRLKGTEVPAFQDTYGWIAHRNGNHDEALTYLEPAAAGLPNDAVAQFHLGMTYLALGRTEDARRQLTRTLELAGDSPLAQFETARQTLAGLPPAPSP